MSKGKLLVMIGCPRSGKSTFSNEWVDEYGHDGPPRVIICADDFRLALHGHRYAGAAEKLVFTHVYYATKALLSRGFHVLLDETSTSELSIRSALELDINADYILIDTPKAVCIERAHLTNQSDLVPVIERIHLQLEKLKAEGISTVFDRIRKSIINKRKD
jgi:predicted kinase